MANIGYLRVSTSDQSTSSQKHRISERYKIDNWFSDESTSGTTKARERDGFSRLMDFVREGDTLVVYAIDRLGRNTIDVLETVQALQAKGCTVISQREGFDLATPIGKAMLTMLAAVGELERNNIKERQMAGIQRAKAEGKQLGRPSTIDTQAVKEWRAANSASIRVTALHFDISPASVKRACAS